MLGSLLEKEYLCTRKHQVTLILKAKVQQKIKICK